MASLPPGLRRKLIDLGPRDPFEVALLIPDTRRALKWFSQNQYAVLGGDVWVKADGDQYRPALDNWSIDAKRDEPWTAYVQRARTLAGRELARIERDYQNYSVAIVPVVATETEYEALNIH
jgi:hypothetical protein